MAAAVESPPISVDESHTRSNSLSRYGVMLFLGAVAIIYLVQVVLALFWWSRPFLGAFTENRSVVNDVRSKLEQNPWPYFAAGGKSQDHLLTLNGEDVSDTNKLAQVLSRYNPGEQAVLEIERQSGTVTERQTVTVVLRRFTFTELVINFLIPYLIAGAYLAMGVWVFLLRGTETSGRMFTVFCAATTAAVGGVFDLWTTHVFSWLWTISLPICGAALFGLGSVFPQPLQFFQRYPRLRLAPFAVAGLIIIYALWSVYLAPSPWEYVVGWRLAYFFITLCVLTFLGLIFYRWLFSPTPTVRDHSGIILLGAGLAFSPVILWMMQFIVGFSFALDVQLFLTPLVFFPLAAMVALLRYRLLDTDARLSQFMVYATLGILTIVGYGLVVWGLGIIVGASLPANNIVVLGLMVFTLVLGLNPLRLRLERFINYTFFRSGQIHEKRLEEFGRDLTRAVTLTDIFRTIRTQVDVALRPTHVHLFLRDPLNNDFGAYIDPTLSGLEVRRFRADVRFAADSALATVLAQGRSAIYLSPETPFPTELQRDRMKLAVLGSAIYAPLPGQATLTGWLSVGPKMSGEPITRNDARFVEAIADQASLAVERATVISDLERRVRELNVVSQMSQAVNFTQTYDDLLELIYAQASRIVDTRNFYIIIKDRRGTSFSYAFFVENNERENEQENKPWAIGRGLSSEILRTGQPIRTDDYLAECRRRNIPPRAKAFKAWMGVPLNAGAETIGIMSVASFEMGVTFTEDQVKIFWTIADQAASAIVKATLYEQTEQRARQLATLNEVSTSMASNLDLHSLLQRILESSMDILGCEAGSLFLTDEETGEYVFRVAAGPVGHNLIGMRIAPGKGLVGEAMESGYPLIVNDAQSDPRLFKGADQTTGFVTTALMVVPLRRGDHRIGAIEVINKRDQTPFTDEDKNLLTAFAGQAAVAIENARLFAQTDQALTERVEELSVLQRIDRELNTALDMQRVMDITLDWALRQGKAYAGSIGMVTEEGIRILATRGYGDVSSTKILPLDQGIMGRVINSGNSEVVSDVQADPDYKGVLASTRSQLTIPIRTANAVMGIVNLESKEVDGFSDDRVAFVSRLLDHASVAITNARLFAEVRAANVAKSDLMNFVAHELKNPMQPVKGYVDILLSGAVGPVNDTQKQFLNVVRNNVERMNTIVSDLNDQASIEAGKLRLEPKPVAFPPIVEEVARATRHLFEAKQQTFNVDIEPSLPNILADHNRTVQILNNLVSNAHKYTPEKGVVNLRVVLGTHPGTDTPALHVAVRDNGVGISPEDQQKIFTKFFRAKGANEMAKGTGLGLNIVKNLIELQGGQIWFESEYGQGSTFQFTIPLAPLQPA